MSFFSILGLVAVGIVVLLLIMMFIAPKDFSLNRSIQVAESPENVFPHILFFEKRNAWYPWMSYDPNMKLSISGTDGKVGTTSYWEGNKKVGKGEQVVTAIKENKRVDTRVKFIEPWTSEADAYITLEEYNGDTKITWGFATQMPMPWNLFGVFMNMDKAVGKDYEKGLQLLKAIVEKENSKVRNP